MAMCLFCCIADPLFLHTKQEFGLVCFASASLNGSRDVTIPLDKWKGNLLGSLPVDSLAHDAHWSFWPKSRLRIFNVGRLHTVDEHHQQHVIAANEFCPPRSLNELIDQLGSDQHVATYGCLLQHCTIEKDLCQGELVHQHIISRGYAANTFLNNLLVQMYGKCGKLQHASAVFDNMPYRNSYSWNIMLAACIRSGTLDDARALFAEMTDWDVVSWSAMISACAQNGYGREALQLFGQMHAKGLEPDDITFICVLDACASVPALEEGQHVHGSIVANGWDFDVVMGNALINMYGKCECVADARAVFVEMPLRNVVSWSAMIAVCAQNGFGKHALQLFAQMQAESIQPNKITFISILDACASVAALEYSRDIHAHIIGKGWESEEVVGNALVDAYGKCKNLDDARAVFVEMPQWDVVSCNTMIKVCTQNEHEKEALQIFGEMQAKCMEPDDITFICLLDACASMAAIEKGQEIHATVVGNGWEDDVIMGNAIINMYGKSGSLDDARAVFLEMPRRDVVSWSAMIAVCAQNGRCKEALELFDQMQEQSIKPNKITFISVLTACCHMGLVSDGRQYLTAMVQDHGLSPSVEHYVCVIDLLGRAGQLDKAEQLINSMPFEYVSPAWLSLLSSCRIHGDVERGVRAADHVFNVDEKNASSYVLLANIQR